MTGAIAFACFSQMSLPIRAVVIRSFADVSSDIGLPSGAVLISEGAALHEMYIVIEGTFVSTSSQVLSAEHENEIALSVFTPGDAMGEMCLYEQELRPTSKVTITCAANGSRVCALRVSTFRKIVQRVVSARKLPPHFPHASALASGRGSWVYGTLDCDDACWPIALTRNITPRAVPARACFMSTPCELLQLGHNGACFANVL